MISLLLIDDHFVVRSGLDAARDALLVTTLGISEDTLKQHVSRILMKLKANVCAQATAHLKASFFILHTGSP